MKKTLLAAALLLGALTVSAQDYTNSIGVTVGSMYGVSYKGFIFGVDGLALQADLGVKLGNFGKTYTTTFKSDFQINGKSEEGYPVTETISHPTKGEIYSMDYFTFELNPNIVYQMEIADFSFGKLSWYSGAGFSIGMMKAATHYDRYYDENGNKHDSWWAMGQMIDVPNEKEKGGGTKKEPMIPLQFKFGVNAIAGLELGLSNAPIAISLDFRPGYGLGYRSDKEEFNEGKAKYTEISSSLISFFDWTLAASVRYCF